MAKSKKNRKGKSQNQQNQKLSPKAYVKKVARKLPVECKIISGWEERGNTQVVVIRKRTNGQLIAGFYMLDIWCLGLKETFYRADLEQSEFDELLENFKSVHEEEVIDCAPEFAFNLIYGAIEYAEDLGFSPHKDFAISEYILDDIDSVEYMDIEFGKDGKPSYFSGPYDNIAKIINTLNKSVGEGNYEFVTHIDLDGEQGADGIRDRPYSSRPDAQRMAEKFEAQDEEVNAIEYMYQLMTADVIHRLIGGDFDKLSETFELGLTDIVVNELAGIINSDIAGLVGEEERKDLERLVNIVTAQMIHYGNGEFLFHDNYQPVLPIPTKEQLEAMSDETFETWQAELKKRETPEERYSNYIKMITFKEVGEMFDMSIPQTFAEDDKTKVIAKITAIFEEAKSKSDVKLQAEEYELINEQVRGFLQFIEEEKYTETGD